MRLVSTLALPVLLVPALCPEGLICNKIVTPIVMNNRQFMW